MWASPEASYWKFSVSPDFFAFENLIHTQSNNFFLYFSSDVMIPGTVTQKNLEFKSKII